MLRISTENLYSNEKITIDKGVMTIGNRIYPFAESIGDNIRIELIIQDELLRSIKIFDNN